MNSGEYYQDRCPVIITERGYYYVAEDGSIGVTQDVDPELDDTWPGLWEFLCAKASDAPFELSVYPDWRLPVGRQVRGALEYGFDFIEEMLEDDLSHLKSGEPEQTWLVTVFPPRFVNLIDRAVCMKLQAFLSRARDKALGQTPSALEFRAEELLVHWAREEAMAYVEVNFEDPQERQAVWAALEDFEQRIQRDFDFLMLYDDSMDGVELVDGLGVGPMALSTWFEPLL